MPLFKLRSQPISSDPPSESESPISSLQPGWRVKLSQRATAQALHAEGDRFNPQHCQLKGQMDQWSDLV